MSDSGQRAWETAMGMRGYAGSPAAREDRQEQRRREMPASRRGVHTPCKECGASFWETYRGAKAETGEIGEDLCDRCEGERLCAVGSHDTEDGKCIHCEQPQIEYRYANNIRWGERYDEKTGFHHIHAESDQAAYEAANRADKAEFGVTFLQRKDADGNWAWCRP